MKYLVVNREELSHSGDTYELKGYRYRNTPISLILVDLPPGEDPKLHAHHYEEIFVIQQGCATYTIGSTILEAPDAFAVSAEEFKQEPLERLARQFSPQGNPPNNLCLEPLTAKNA